jgi:hypothetical protein
MNQHLQDAPTGFNSISGTTKKERDSLNATVQLQSSGNGLITHSIKARLQANRQGLKTIQQGVEASYRCLRMASSSIKVFNNKTTIERGL